MKNKFKFILLLLFVIAILVVVWCSIFPVSVKLTDMCLITSEDMTNMYKDSLNRAKSNPESYQIFGELPEMIDGNECVRVTFTADVKSHTIYDITPCYLMFDELDNTDNRFLFSDAELFSTVVYPFRSNVVSVSLFVNRAGLSNQELEQCLHKMKLRLIYGLDAKRSKTMDLKVPENMELSVWNMDEE